MEWRSIASLKYDWIVDLMDGDGCGRVGQNSEEDLRERGEGETPCPAFLSRMRIRRQARTPVRVCTLRLSAGNEGACCRRLYDTMLLYTEERRGCNKYSHWVGYDSLTLQ